MCEAFDEFLTTYFQDWVYLEGPSSDLDVCDQLITEHLIGSADNHAMIANLLASSCPRQVFGEALLRLVDDRIAVASDALRKTITNFGLPEDTLSADKTLLDLKGYIQGQGNDVAEQLIGSLVKSGDSNQSEASIIQAVGVAIDLIHLVIKLNPAGG